LLVEVERAAPRVDCVPNRFGKFSPETPSERQRYPARVGAEVGPVVDIYEVVRPHQGRAGDPHVPNAKVGLRT
jgi:hypothetical protein